MELRASTSRNLYARRIVLIAILADVVTIGAYAVQLFLSPSRQMQWMIANAGGLLLVYLLVYFLLRRPAMQGERRMSQVFWLAILATELSFIGSAFTVAGLEIFYAVILILLIAVAARPPALAQHEYPWAVISVLAAGALILLPLVLPLEYRLVAPSQLRIFSYSTLILTLVLYGVYASAAYPISLRVKLPFATVFISLLSVSVIGLLANRIAAQALQSAGEKSLSSAALQVSTQLEDYLLNNIEIVRTQAQLPLFRNYLLVQAGEAQRPASFIEVGQTLLAFQSRNTPYILSYGLLNERGIVVADTLSSHLGLDESGEEYFRRAILGISNVSDIRYRGSPPQAVLAFAAPVRAIDGRPIGVLRFWLLPSVVQQIVSANSGLAGEQSFAVLVDDNGIILAHGESPQLNGQVIRSLEESTINSLYAAGRLLPGTSVEVAPMTGLGEGLERLSQTRFFDLDVHAQDVIISRERATARRMFALPWTVVYYQSVDFFTQPLRQQRNVIVLATVALSFIVALMGVLISEAIVRPLRQLRDAAQQVQQGDLNIRLAVRTRDETGVLADVFMQMVRQVRDLLTNLEARVEERTLALAERSSYLQAVADVGRLIFSLRDPQVLIARVVEIIRSRFGLYYVGFFEVDGSGEWAVLRAGTGEAGQAMLARGHRIRIGSGMIGWSIAHNQPRIAQQAELDAVRLRTPELPETRSEAALPLRTRSGVIGALTIQSARPNAFNPDNLAIFQVLADLVASALENARLYAEMESAMHSLEHVFAERVRSTLEEYFHAHGSTTYRSDGTQVWEDARAWYTEMEEALKRGETVIGEPIFYEQEQIYPLAIPILMRGQAVGVLRTYKPAEKGPWTSQEVRVLQNILDQIALTLEASQLFEQTQQRAIYEHILSEITGKVWSASGVEGILQTAVRELGRALNAGEIEIALTEDGHEA